MVEERLNRLESHVDHVQADVSEMKTDLRGLHLKVDGVKDSIASLKVWCLLMGAGLLAVMAAPSIGFEELVG